MRSLARPLLLLERRGERRRQAFDRRPRPTFVCAHFRRPCLEQSPGTEAGGRPVDGQLVRLLPALSPSHHECSHVGVQAVASVDVRLLRAA
eukprot:6017695-Prymnesium_polylepis.2